MKVELSRGSEILKILKMGRIREVMGGFNLIAHRKLGQMDTQLEVSCTANSGQSGLYDGTLP